MLHFQNPIRNLGVLLALTYAQEKPSHSKPSPKVQSSQEVSCAIQIIFSAATEEYTSWAKLKTKSSRMTTCIKTSNTQKPLKPAEENKDADEDTESDDEAIAKKDKIQQSNSWNPTSIQMNDSTTRHEVQDQYYKYSVKAAIQCISTGKGQKFKLELYP